MVDTDLFWFMRVGIFLPQPHGADALKTVLWKLFTTFFGEIGKIAIIVGDRWFYFRHLPYEILFGSIFKLHSVDVSATLIRSIH